MKSLSEHEAKKVLKEHGIPVTRQELAISPTEAVRHAKSIGFPVVMKIASPGIIHKTEAGCVVCGVDSAEKAAAAYKKIIANAMKANSEAKIEGVIIQETLSGKEVIVGMKRDAQFGPVVMVGLGGIFVEVFKDVSFRIVPLTRDDAREMISELMAYPILKGARGEKPVKLSAIEDVILKVSSLASRNRKIEELDINPLFVDEKGACAADARIILS